MITGAKLSKPGAVLPGAQRGYLERDGMRCDPRHVEVLQDAVLEDWPERWSLYVSPSVMDADQEVLARVLTEELGRRFGYREEEIYIARHSDTGRVHIHAVVPARKGVKIRDKDMAVIGRKIATELELDRRVERLLSKAPEGEPATEAQKAVLGRLGWFDRTLTKREASEVIEALMTDQGPRARRAVDVELPVANYGSVEKWLRLKETVDPAKLENALARIAEIQATIDAKNWSAVLSPKGDRAKVEAGLTRMRAIDRKRDEDGGLER